uniref:Putative lipocalin-3 1 n=1 Tax=Amblyomma cajennense TaxID=34607 RepID=A0A023FQU1_AMBCJ
MADARICSVLLFAFLLTVVSSEGEDVEISNVDIVKFLTESPKLWVYNTTEQSNITCRLDVYNSVTANETSFSRFSRNGTREEEKNLTGTFFLWEGGNTLADGKYDAIKISDGIQREYPLSEEVFEFQSKDGTCAVVAVLDNSSGMTKTWLDLRVNNSAIESEPGKECSGKFEEILQAYHVRDRTWRISYDRECKNKLS